MLALALTVLAAAAPPVTVHRIEFRRGDRSETRIVARDRHSGRRFVLARGSRRTHLGDWWVSGRRVVYVEATSGGESKVVRLHVVRVAASVRRLQTLRLFLAPRRAYVPLDAVMTSRGRLAWLSPDGVIVRRRGGRRRVVSRETYDAIDLEDDRTLRLDGREYIDLRPGSEPDCGGRERFRPVFRSRDVIVTRAAYGGIDVRTHVLRACRRADGRDPVVAVADSIFPGGVRLDVPGADRDWVVVTWLSCDRYGGGCSVSVRAMQAGSGRRGLGATFYEAREPDQYWPPLGLGLAVSDAGLPAWVSEVRGVARLVAVLADDSYRVLDTGSPGAIRDLAFVGDTLMWTHEGEPRSADLGPG